MVRKLVVIAFFAVLLLAAVPAQAITNGEEDGEASGIPTLAGWYRRCGLRTAPGSTVRGR